MAWSGEGVWKNKDGSGKSSGEIAGTVGGAVVGGVMGGPVGAAAGASAGARLGKYGAKGGLENIGGAIAGNNPLKGPERPDMAGYQIDPTAFDPTQRQNDLYGYMNRHRRMLENRDAFSMDAAQLDPAAQAQMRERQIALANQLGAQARGEGPSLARMQMKEATDRGLAQASQMAAGQRGLSAGMRARMMNQVAGQTRADAARAAAMGRAQEQMNAQNSLASVLAGARGQDLSMAQQNAALQQQANQANLQSQIGNRALTDQTRLAYYNQLGGMANKEQDAAIAREAMQSGNYNAVLGNQASMYGADQQRQGQMMGGLFGAAGAGLAAAAAASDERVKTNIKDGNKALTSFLDAIGSKEYTYKDKGYGAGKYVSPMAQELEKTELGKSMVKTDPTSGVKMVDYARGAGTYLSLAKHLHERLSKIEKKKRRA